MDSLNLVVDATILEGFPACVTKSLFRYCTVGLSEKLKSDRYFVSFDHENHTARIETTNAEMIDWIKKLFSVTAKPIEISKGDLIQEQKTLTLQRSLANVERCEPSFARDGVCAVDVVSSASDAKSLPAIIDFLQFIFSHVTFAKTGELVKLIVPQKFSKLIADALIHDQVSFKIYLPKVEVFEMHPGKGNLSYRVKIRLLLDKKSCLQLINNSQVLKTPPFFNVRSVDELIDPW